MNGKKSFGDYQTPIDFTQRVCSLLIDKYTLEPTTVIEPTCGYGSFLKSSLVLGAKNNYGIEINYDYCKRCRQELLNENVEIINADFFEYDLSKIITDNILFIGNPPWVTNSALSKMEATNTPIKSNIKGLRGFEALTGKSNFDICEYIILKIVKATKLVNSNIAMLCKTSVARNIYLELNRRKIHFSKFDIYEFNAKKIFDISTSACLLYINFSTSNKCSNPTYKVYSFDTPNQLLKEYICEENTLKLSKSNVLDFYGNSCFEWRQGVKHDCSNIMELTYDGVNYYNKTKTIVDVEENYIFPLIKSSMFKNILIDNSSKYVIVPQKRVNEDTSKLEKIAPKLWEYLQTNKASFEKRKSIIYKKSPPFSIFGVGDYSFSQFKVGISGFYKKPIFSLLYGNKPMMTDDTGYFICFNSFENAYVATVLLNSYKMQEFLKNLSFQDAKRPFTKQLLSKIDFDKALKIISFAELLQVEKDMELENTITVEMFDNFKKLVHNMYNE